MRWLQRANSGSAGSSRSRSSATTACSFEQLYQVVAASRRDFQVYGEKGLPGDHGCLFHKDAS